MGVDPTVSQHKIGSATQRSLGTGGLVSIVSYSRPSFMIIASRTQFHVVGAFSVITNLRMDLRFKLYSPALHLQGRGPTSEDILVYLCVMGNWWDVLTAVFMNVDVFIVSIEFRRCMFASVPSSLKWYIWPAWKDFTFCFLFAICLIYISGACPSFATLENFTSTCNQQHSFRGHKNNGNSNSMKFN